MLVILEIDGPTEALLAAAADLEARRSSPAVLAQAFAPTATGLVVATFWESARRVTRISQIRRTARRCRRAVCSTR